MTRYLVDEAKLNVNAQDNYGDTSLHDAAKFGHIEVVKILLEAGANVTLRNKQVLLPHSFPFLFFFCMNIETDSHHFLQGKDPLAMAVDHDKPEVAALLRAAATKRPAKI